MSYGKSQLETMQDIMLELETEFMHVTKGKTEIKPDEMQQFFNAARGNVLTRQGKPQQAITARLPKITDIVRDELK